MRKNLILRLAVPRFFVQGDEVVISALVHNYLATAKNGARLARHERPRRDSTAPRKMCRCPAAARPRWIGAFARKQVRSATLTGKALTDEEIATRWNWSCR